jgi:hypothetical protein
MASPGTRLKLPPPSRAIRPIVETCLLDTQLVRIYDPRPPHRASELTFRHFGPLLRFDHHSLIKDEAADDPARAIWYAAYEDLSCAIVETFADDQVIRPQYYRLAAPRIIEPLRLLDLRRNGAIRAGTTPEISKTGEYSYSWSWSRYWYQEHACESVDGILYYGARNDGLCVALYERAESRLECNDCSIELGHPALRDELLRIADETGYRLVL